MPRPDSRVIPTGWSEHHQPTAESVMTATCRITRRTAATGVYDSSTGRTTYTAPTEVYEGPCRIQRAALTGTQAPIRGEKLTPVRPYTVSLPITAEGIQVNDLVEILTADDPDTTGKHLTVVDVRGGSLLWQRDLICDEHTPTTR